ncbi:hypothetical protein PROAA_400008 [Candidatus Propionivibrio aalborgensis]|uniref:Uncharacterized protein n=1 Tax=Candidatus Propionivibrio aalborgensis TaxID=1860101 RepID=A0A1A8Y020_9RHOO|nr:hypothetical protein PROAA_400008 [Candidatus Propionivibrio aalborgensis]
MDVAGLLKTHTWPPRRESNPYLTLRRRVHYPLCYEEIGAYFIAPVRYADKFRSIHENAVLRQSLSSPGK